MMKIDASTKRALLSGIAAAQHALERDGKANTDAHRLLRTIEDTLGAHPSRECLLLDAPAEPSEFDSVLVKRILQDLPPRKREALYRLMDSPLFGN